MRIRSRWVNWLFAKSLVATFRLLFATLRREFHHAREDVSPYVPIGENEYIYCVWHDSLVMPIFLGRQRHTIALVGQHRDGDYVSDVLAGVGMPSVRGSSSKGGAQAVAQLVNQTAGSHIVLTPDGPRGPRRQLKPGLGYLSKKTGKAIVPTAFAATSMWHIKGSWTDLAIPRPFSKVYTITGEPIVVPTNARKQELADCLAQVQSAMDRINEQVQRLANGDAIEIIDDSSRSALRDAA